MKLGFILPQIGPAASPEAIVQVSKRAEELGYDSLWVTDRLLYPVSPKHLIRPLPMAHYQRRSRPYSTLSIP